MVASNFIQFVQTDYKLWQSKIEKSRRFLCAHMVDFCRLSHIYLDPDELEQLVYQMALLSIHYCNIITILFSSIGL